MDSGPTQVTLIKNLINDSADETSLKVNFDKSNMIPLNCSDQIASAPTNILECQIGSIPFTYLGLPLRRHNSRFMTFD